MSEDNFEGLLEQIAQKALCRSDPSYKGVETMSAHHIKAVTMQNFKLSGQDIEIRYQDKKLSLSGDKIFGGERTFPDDKIAKSEGTIGEHMTVVLLNSTRNGAVIRLHLIVPQMLPSKQDVAIRGVAIVARDLSNLVGGGPNVLQDYDHILPLVGTMIAG